MPTSQIKMQAETKMDQSIAAFKNNISKIRTGRASPALLESVQVDYYGNLTPISQVANLSMIDSRTVGVQPWEKGMGTRIKSPILEGFKPKSLSRIAFSIFAPMPFSQGCTPTVRESIMDKLATWLIGVKLP